MEGKEGDREQHVAGGIESDLVAIKRADNIIETPVGIRWRLLV